MNLKKSLLLITVDCLRADHTGFMGYSKPTTPCLDSLSKECFVFPAAMVGGAPTYYSLPTILASRYPLALGRDVVGLAPVEPSLASILKGAGYATAAFNAGNPYISKRFGYDQGFDQFRDFLEGDARDKNGPDSAEEGGTKNPLTHFNSFLRRSAARSGLTKAAYDELYFQYCQNLTFPRPKALDALRRFPAANIIVDQARAWLASLGDSPFFLWLHLMDPHAPYYPVGEALEAMGGAAVTPSRARYLNSYWNRGDLSTHRLRNHRDEIVQLYDAGIRWADLQIRRLVDSMTRSRQWDNCVFALTADHGEEFLEHRGRYHPPSNLKEELIQVPLLMRVPDCVASDHVTSDSPFSLLHLAPTLLGAIDIDSPAEFSGVNLWPSLRNGESWDLPAVVESARDVNNPFHRHARLKSRAMAVREKRYKLILEFDPLKDELYDLKEDPLELRPLAMRTEPAVRRRLMTRALQHLTQTSQSRSRVQRLGALTREIRLELAVSHQVKPPAIAV